jgi:two-component system cell cycle response regulator CtrA
LNFFDPTQRRGIKQRCVFKPPCGGIDEPETKIIDVFMCKLRRKLADAGATGVIIDTIYGQDYILREMRDYDAMKVSA